jgi:superfamily I DNA/RNA helicase
VVTATRIHKRIAEIYHLYNERLMLANAMDFDDLLLNAVAMLKKDDEVRSSYQNRFKYLLVDEFQDTNGVQNQLVMLLAEKHRNLCVVGDSDQSIYRFRAADVRNILQFEQRFPDAVSDPAGTELPLDPDDPRRGQRRHLEELESTREEPLHRRRPGREDTSLSRR